LNITSPCVKKLDYATLGKHGQTEINTGHISRISIMRKKLALNEMTEIGN